MLACSLCWMTLRSGLLFVLGVGYLDGTQEEAHHHRDTDRQQDVVRQSTKFRATVR